MDMDTNRFRSNLFGGFHRGDVADYIEKLASERSSLDSRLHQAKKRLEELEKENKRLQCEKDVLGREVARLAKEKKELESRQTAEQEAKDACRAEAMAQAAEKLEALIGLMECAARDTRQDAVNARAQLEELCTGLEAGADAAEEVCRRLRQAQAELRGQG